MLNQCRISRIISAFLSTHIYVYGDSYPCLKIWYINKYHSACGFLNDGLDVPFNWYSEQCFCPVVYYFFYISVFFIFNIFYVKYFMWNISSSIFFFIADVVCRNLFSIISWYIVCVLESKCIMWNIVMLSLPHFT